MSKAASHAASHAASPHETLSEAVNREVERLITAVQRLRDSRPGDPGRAELACDVCLASRESWTVYFDLRRLGVNPPDTTKVFGKALEDALRLVVGVAKELARHGHPYLEVYMQSVADRQNMYKLLQSSGLDEVKAAYARRASVTEDASEAGR